MNQINKSKKQVEVEAIVKLIGQVKKARHEISSVNQYQQSAIEKYLLGIESQLEVEVNCRSRN
jgi:hypothetical protein